MDQTDAGRLWSARKPLAGSLAGRYLNLSKYETAVLAPSIAAGIFDYFAPLNLHCIIAAVRTLGGTLTAVQRTFFAPTAESPITTPCICSECAGCPLRYCQGNLGGGAVQIGWPDRVLGLAPSVEGALAMSRAYSFPVWATLGAGRMHHVQIPRYVDHLVLFMRPAQIASGWADHVHGEQLWHTDSVEVIADVAA